MDSKRVKLDTWLWWVVEDKPVYITEILKDGFALAYIPRINSAMCPHIVSKVIRAIDLVGLGEIGELDF